MLPKFCVGRYSIYTKANLASDTQEQLAMDNGVLFAAPIPEEGEADGNIIQAAIDQAIAESGEKAITGPSATPWLLTRISELTNGKSLAANVALLKNTALIGMGSRSANFSC